MLDAVLSRTSIKTRIWSLSLLAGTSIAMMWGLQAYFDQGITKAFDTRQMFGEAEITLNEGGKAFQRMRRHEREFVALKQARDAAGYRDERGKAEAAIKKFLDNPAFANNAEVQSEAQKLHALLIDHAAAFELAFGKRQALGFNLQAGLTGQMRKETDKIESLLKAYGQSQSAPMQLLSLARRSDLDYQLQRQARFLQAEREQLRSIASSLETMPLAESQRSVLLPKAKALLVTFDDYVKASEDYDAAQKQLDFFSSAAEPLMTSLGMLVKTGADTAAQDLWAAQSNMRWRSTLLSLAMLGVMTLLSWFIGLSIMRPLKGVAKSFDSLASGTVISEIPGAAQKNEIGALARAADSFRLALASQSELESKSRERAAQDLEQAQKSQERDAAFGAELAEIVAACNTGDFSKRMTEENYKANRRVLAKSINAWTNGLGAVFNEISLMMSKLANGELQHRFGGTYQGKFADLQGDIDSVAKTLQDIAAQITGASKSVQAAASEIGDGVSNLAMRTEHQASSLEETAASMEELAATIRQNSDNAQQADELASSARLQATNGSKIVNETVQAMSRIEESSKRMSEIVALIQDFAFQTNILALNAAVEAARAGEAGRGFAVVANEVRTLAQRSAEASKDIKGLIVTTNQHISEGVTLVQSAGTSLAEITRSATSVADIISEIAAASREQSHGVDQVSRTVFNMEELTRRNADLVETTNAALTVTQGEIEKLTQAVGFFKSEGVEQIVTEKPEPAPAKDHGLANKLRALAQHMQGGLSNLVGKSDEQRLVS
jgi:methyl-accepting chemotaxis protein